MNSILFVLIGNGKQKTKKCKMNTSRQFNRVKQFAIKACIETGESFMEVHYLDHIIRNDMKLNKETNQIQASQEIIKK